MIGKPSWDDAPAWANYLVMDGNGRWYWHQIKPFISTLGDWWLSGGLQQSANTSSHIWTDTLEERKHD